VAAHKGSKKCDQGDKGQIIEVTEEGGAVYSDDNIDDEKEGKIDKDIGVFFNLMKGLPF